MAEADNAAESLGPKQTDAKALKKCLSGNFKGGGDEPTHMTYVDGINLVDTLTRDRGRAQTDKDFKMGKVYYQRVREVFGGVSPEQLIPIIDEGEPDDCSLHKVLRQAFAHSRKLEPLSEYVKTVPAVSKKEHSCLVEGVSSAVSVFLHGEREWLGGYVAWCV